MTREQSLMLARQDRKIVEMETRFNELSGTHFRINGINESCGIEDLMIKAYFNKKIMPLINENSKLNPTVPEESSQLIRNLDSIKEYQANLNELVVPVEAEINVKSMLTSKSKSLFLSIDGKDLMFTSCVVTETQMSNVSEFKVNNINDLKKQLDFKCTPAMKTALSNASDYLMFNLKIDSGHLLLNAINIKNGKSDSWGILGHKSSKINK